MHPPYPTVTHLVERATRDYGAVAAMAYAAHLSDDSAASIVDRALAAAIEDCGMQVSPETRADARQVLLCVGWEAREDRQQEDINADDAITRGAARHEGKSP